MIGRVNCWSRQQVCRMGLNLCSFIKTSEHRILKSFLTYFPPASGIACDRRLSFQKCKTETFNIDITYSVLRKSKFHNNNFFDLKSFTTTSVLSKKKKSKKEKTVYVQEEDINEIEANILDDPDFDALRSDSDILGFIGSQSNQRFDLGVLVLQPWVKWGPRMKQNTTSQMMLDEAAALMSTLPGIRVIHKEVVPVKSMESKTVFGSGTLNRLVAFARSSKGITSVFISVDMLKNIQIEALEEAFGLRVMDRYSVVLSIFRQHARTKEAKLQVALAELPYVTKRLGIRGEKERMLMMEREKRLRNALNTIAGKRAHIRQNRVKSDIPTIAVVGYTNAGKTSLIHAITGDTRAEGKDQLFATLDVTAHGGRLPCGLEVLFIDTVGFIQEIPTDLIASFRATLEDAICADVIVHIRDASHPDYDLQGITVEETLSSLPVPEKTPIITVANKIDLGTVKPEADYPKTHLVSAATGQGLKDLLIELESEVLSVTGRQFWRFSLLTGSDEIRWLRSATGLVSEEMDPDNPQMTNVVAVMTDQELAAFKRNFRSRN